MRYRLAERLAAVFEAGEFGTAIEWTVATCLVAAVLAILWYAYASKYVFEPRARIARRYR